MGCDIHLFREKKVNDSWECLEPFETTKDQHEGGKVYIEIDNPHLGRNYALFGFLANVRREIPEGFNPRGLPADVSALVNGDSESWDSDGHSHSWLSLSEIKNKLTEFLIAPTEFSPYYVPDLQHIVSLFPDETAEYRIVFWFDN